MIRALPLAVLHWSHALVTCFLAALNASVCDSLMSVRGLAGRSLMWFSLIGTRCCVPGPMFAGFYPEWDKQVATIPYRISCY